MSRKGITPVVDAFITKGTCKPGRLRRVMSKLMDQVNLMLTERIGFRLIRTRRFQCDLCTFFEESAINNVYGIVFAAEVRIGGDSFTITLIVSEVLAKPQIFKKILWTKKIRPKTAEIIPLTLTSFAT